MNTIDFISLNEVQLNSVVGGNYLTWKKNHGNISGSITQPTAYYSNGNTINQIGIGNAGIIDIHDVYNSIIVINFAQTNMF